MTEERRRAKALDAALRGETSDDETRPLLETAERVKRDLSVDVPPADRQRALFLSGVASRRGVRFSPGRLAVPAMAVAVVLFAFLAGRRALPGEQLYPVREALNAVGIGETPVAQVDDYLNESARLIAQAEEIVDSNPERALALAIRGLEELGPARQLVGGLSDERAEEKLDQIEDFEDGALDTIEDALDERADAEEDRRHDSGDDSGSDDSSGPGSGDDGSGDDSGSDDSSGPGSDDDSGSDDSSGPGSDGSGGSDSSGSGSGDSGGEDD